MEFQLQTHHDATCFDLLWGVTAISKAIGRSKPTTSEMLERGQIPPAKKYGTRWCVSRRRLAEQFEAA